MRDDHASVRPASRLLVIAAFAAMAFFAVGWNAGHAEPSLPVADAADASAFEATALSVDAHQHERESEDVLPRVAAGGLLVTRTFAQFVAELVELGRETARLAEAGDDDGAHEHDRQARALFCELLREIHDAAEQSLQALGAEAPVPSNAPGMDVSQALRRNVLLLTLTVAMQQRLEATGGDRTSTDGLTTGALTLLLACADLAPSLGIELLADKPYLGPPHEPLVLELVAASGSGRFPQDVAVRLLSTLWANLQREGERSSSQLAGLAMLLLDSSNIAERLAAARRLILDERYRDATLAHLRRTRDRDLARAVAMAAAEELPAAAAFSVLTLAAEITGQETGPFLTLAHREPGMIRAEYEQRLGSDVTPRVRAMLVAGAGFTGSPEGIEMAQLALGSDPDAEVRLRAVFVLTGKTPTTLGEAAVARALDDPQIGGNPARLAALVLAVENLARAGQVNAVHRLGERMLATAGLSPYARSMLDQLLADTLPGGGAAARAGG